MLNLEQTRPAALRDRALIDALYTRFGHGDSAHAFASLLLWQGDMGLSLAADEAVYTVRSCWKGEGAWFFPVGSEEGKRDCVEALLKGGLRALYYLTEEDAAFLRQHFPDSFVLREAPEDSEYLYERQDMIAMSGAPFVKIRNLYHHLEREHAVTAEPVTEALFPLVQEIAAQWKPGSSPEGSITDRRFMDQMYASWTALGLQGVILRLDGTPWAVSAGYPLTEDTFDCCLMKSRQNLPGIAEHLRAALARQLPERVRLINFEEDLGIAGLRQMKTRFRPCGRINMYAGERV